MTRASLILVNPTFSFEPREYFLTFSSFCQQSKIFAQFMTKENNWRKEEKCPLTVGKKKSALNYYREEEKCP